MAHEGPGGIAAPVPAAEQQALMQREATERGRYLTKMGQQEGLAKWSPEQAVKHGVDMVPHATIQPQEGPRPDIPPGIITGAHISTAQQGSTYPGFKDPRFVSRRRQLYPWHYIKRALDTTMYPNAKVDLKVGETQVRDPTRPFVAAGIQEPRPGIGDANTDELLQQALKSYLMKGELHEKNLLEFSRDRPWRGR